MPEVREHPPSTQKMSTTGSLGGGAGGPGASTINAKNVDGGPLGGGAGGLGAPSINAKNVDGGPLGGGVGGLVSIHDPQQVCCDLHVQHR
jgi:hypothetical protein